MQQKIEIKGPDHPEPFFTNLPTKEDELMPLSQGLGRGNRDGFLQNLLSKRTEVKETLERLLAGDKEYTGLLSADAFIDELDHAEREIAAQTRYKLIDRKNRELHKIDILIRRIQREDAFGLCEECGDPIPAERLLIIPDAACCVPCQRELEKFENRKGLGSDAHIRPAGKKDFHCEQNPGAEEDDIIFMPDMDGVSLLDLEETELAEKRNGISNTQQETEKQ